MFSYIRSHTRKPGAGPTPPPPPPAAATSTPAEPPLAFSFPPQPPIKDDIPLPPSQQNFISEDESAASHSSVPSNPPVLPPIPRITSHHGGPGNRGSIGFGQLASQFQAIGAQSPKSPKEPPWRQPQPVSETVISPALSSGPSVTPPTPTPSNFQFSDKSPDSSNRPPSRGPTGKRAKGQKLGSISSQSSRDNLRSVTPSTSTMTLQNNTTRPPSSRGNATSPEAQMGPAPSAFGAQQTKPVTHTTASPDSYTQPPVPPKSLVHAQETKPVPSTSAAPQETHHNPLSGLPIPDLHQVRPGPSHVNSSPDNIFKPTIERPDTLAYSRSATVPYKPSHAPPDLSDSSGSMTSRVGSGLRIQPMQPLLNQPRSKSPPKSGKKMFLKNPMSLLVKRRQPEYPPEDALSPPKSLPVPPSSLPDDYDPRIRGKGIHDFSAPRPKRTVSFGDPDLMYPGRLSRPHDQEVREDSPSKEHTPVFKENFDESNADSEAAIRAERLQNNDFVARNLGVPDGSMPPMPAMPPPKPPPLHSPPPLPQPSTSEFPSPPSYLPPPPPSEIQVHSGRTLETVPETGRNEAVQDSLHKKTSSKSMSSKSTKSPRQNRSRAPSGAELPSHLTSRASRFSFQMSNGDSASEEKLLEEKHKQRAETRTFNRQSKDSRFADMDIYDDDMYDIDPDLDDDFEERIPGVNADFDDGFDNPVGNSSLAPIGQTQDMSGFHFSSPQSAHFSQFSPDRPNAATPRDPYGNPIGFATSAVSPLLLSPLYQGQGANMNIHDALMGDDPAADANRPGSDIIAQQADVMRKMSAVQKALDEIHSESSEDDLYFDDGIIDASEKTSGDKFDESAFDDPSHPLYERKAPADIGNLNSKPDEDRASPRSEEEDSSTTPASSRPGHSLKPSLESQEELTPVLEQSNAHSMAFQASQKHLPDAPVGHQTGQPAKQSMHNLNVYHSALAEAATKAEADGRFQRKDSIDSPTLPPQGDEVPISLRMREGDPPSISSRPSLIPDDSRASQATIPSQDRWSGEADNRFDSAGTFGGMYDAYGDDRLDDFSDLDDDPMVAAANAEALANDLEDFYGDEFGFYAQSAGEGQMINGGFFGPRGVVNRSLSGRNAVREPNLTPITELSEYSTRNSFISLSHFGPVSMPSSAVGSFPPSAQQLMSPTGAPHPLTSPALAQFARRSPYGIPTDDDSDITYSNLAKLRRSAFGGSNGSLKSTGSSQGSPKLNAQNQLKSGSSAPIPEENLESNELTKSKTGERNEPSNAGWGNKMSRTDSDLSQQKEVGGHAGTDTIVSHRHGMDSNVFGYEDVGPEDDYMDDAFSSPGDASSPSEAGSPTIHAETWPGGTGRQPPGAMQSGHDAFPEVLPAARYSPNEVSSNVASGNVRSPQSITSPSSVFSATEAPPLSATSEAKSKRAGHSRTSSSADSVTYVREQDEGGRERWVLERRRTGEDGEIEVDRSVVSGGRI